MLRHGGGFKKFVIVAAVSAFAWTPSPAGADVVFRATCGSLKGHRVNMDPNGKSNIEKWTPELYPVGALLTADCEFVGK